MRDKMINAAEVITMWKEGMAIVTLSKDGYKIDMRIHSDRWVTDEFNMSIVDSGTSQKIYYNYKKVSNEDAQLWLLGGVMLVNQRIKLTYRGD